jgi:hypothetical protein
MKRRPAARTAAAISLLSALVVICAALSLAADASVTSAHREVR